VKKVADKLNSLALNEREEYATIWKDIAPFIEYASIKDRKFYDRVKQSILLNLVNGDSMTVEEYLKDAEGKHDGKIYYSSDRALQAQYISMFEAKDIKVALFERAIDVQFASFAEGYGDGAIKFLRVDSNINDILSDGEITESESLKDIFSGVIDEHVNVEFGALSDESIPALLSVDEEIRRMEEMMRMYGITQPTPPDKKLIINTASPLIKKLEALCENDKELADELAEHIYRLALLSQKKFTAEEMKEFMDGSYKLLMKL
jgi:molecular chaperone HtpG